MLGGNRVQDADRLPKRWVKEGPAVNYQAVLAYDRSFLSSHVFYFNVTSRLSTEVFMLNVFFLRHGSFHIYLFLSCCYEGTCLPSRRAGDAAVCLSSFVCLQLHILTIRYNHFFHRWKDFRIRGTRSANRHIDLIAHFDASDWELATSRGIPE